jgi:hypothetical protein
MRLNAIILGLALALTACAAERSDVIYPGLAAPTELVIGEAARRGAALAIE